jgi:hypothetical protein
MRRLLIVSIIILLMQSTARDARAARGNFFLIDSPVQKVDLIYQFDGSQQVNNSERHALTEDYTFKLNYAILQPKLFKGSIKATLRFDQKLASNNGGNDSSSSSTNYLYDITGELLGASTTPAAFSVSSDILRVSTPFTRTFQLTNKNYDLRWSLKNSMLPVSVEYSTGTSESSGLPVDSTREHNQINLRTSHRERNNSTSLELKYAHNLYTPKQGEGNFDNRAEVRLVNNLAWINGGKNRSFDSQFSYSETAGINLAKYLNFEQSATWDLGKSLRSGGNYSLSTISGDPGSQTHQNSSLWVQHQLFNSLTTKFLFRASESSYPTGNESEVGGDVSLAYVKKLPQESSLSLVASDGYTLNDRNLGSGLLKIFNEQHAVLFGVNIVLAQPNVVIANIIIHNADPLKRLLPYNSGIDYQMVQNGALTEIVITASGAISTGDTLLISYDFMVDPHIKSTSETLSTSASLTLFGGDYRIYGFHSQSRHETLSGQATLSSLTVQQMSRLGFERNWKRITLSSEYETYDSTADRHQSVQSMARFSDGLGAGNMSLMLSDRYQWYGVVTQGSTTVQRADENFFTAAANFTTSISSTTQWSVTSKYINVSGATSSDSVMVSSTLRWSLGKLTAALESSFGMRRQEGAMNFDENIRVSVSRYFY